MGGFVGVEDLGVAEGEGDVVEAVEEAVFAEGVDVEAGVETFVVGDGLVFEVDGDPVGGVCGGSGDEEFDLCVVEADEDDAVFAGVGVENVGEAGGDDGEETVLVDGPGGVFAGGAAAEVLFSEQDLCAGVGGVVEDERGVGLAGGGGLPGCGASHRRGSRRSRCARCASGTAWG